MKKDIHPNYVSKAKITCVCGATMTTGSTQSEIKTEICSNCHPFYTGKKKFVDATGRVDRFKKMTKKAEDAQKSARKAPKVRKEQTTSKKAVK